MHGFAFPEYPQGAFVIGTVKSTSRDCGRDTGNRYTWTWLPMTPFGMFQGQWDRVYILVFDPEVWISFRGWHRSGWGLERQYTRRPSFGNTAAAVRGAGAGEEQ